MDLTTHYLGMELKNPLVPSASPLSRSLDTAKRLEDAGAAALVMYSLFEEDLYHEEQVMDRLLHNQSLGHAEASSYLPVHGDIPSKQDRYLEQLQQLKSSLEIPIIASLNGITMSGWVDHGTELQQAGADALELNVYYIAGNLEEDSNFVEQRYIDLLTELRRHVSIPIIMKLSPQFSALTHFCHRLEQAGATGVSLFNRFFQPDIDLDSLRVAPQLHLSNSNDSLLAMRWIAILFGRTRLTLAATGGIHTANDALKLLLAGADVTHLCSTLLLHGPKQVGTILRGMEAWLEESPYENIEQLKGVLSQQHAADPSTFARSNYVQMIDGYILGNNTWR